jgi:hypothetical protein
VKLAGSKLNAILVFLSEKEAEMVSSLRPNVGTRLARTDTGIFGSERERS